MRWHYEGSAGSCYSIAKSLVAACIFLILAGRASINAAAPGFLEGHLKIVSLNKVKPADKMPRQSVTAEIYAEYPLVILSQEEKKEIARVTADENGTYRTVLVARRLHSGCARTRA